MASFSLPSVCLCFADPNVSQTNGDPVLFDTVCPRYVYTAPGVWRTGGLSQPSHLEILEPTSVWKGEREGRAEDVKEQPVTLEFPHTHSGTPLPFPTRQEGETVFICQLKCYFLQAGGAAHW